MTNANSEKQAVVLSGGGANGAYEVGVMKALLSGKSPTTNYQPLCPDIFTGTSVGAYNAAFLTAQWDMYGIASIANLEQAWLTQVCDRMTTCGNGVYEIRSNPLSLTNPYCYYPNPIHPFTQLAQDSAVLAWDGIQRLVSLSNGNQPLLERVANLFNFSSFVSSAPFAQLVIDTISFPAIRSSSRTLRVSATNWASGRVKNFSNQELTNQLGPDVILASAAIPGFFPVQHVGSQPFVDGGVLLNTPLQPAISAGADVLHVISLDPEVEKIPLSDMSNTLATAWREQVIGWVKSLDQSIRQVWAINRTVELVELALRATRALQDRSGDLTLAEFEPEAMQKLQEIYPGQQVSSHLSLDLLQGYLRQEIQNYRPLTVYLYRPKDSLGGPLGLLNFDCKRVEELIERGFGDAMTFEPTDETYVPPCPLGTVPASSPEDAISEA